jgi:phosphatidate cytidylyltransferase
MHCLFVQRQPTAISAFLKFVYLIGYVILPIILITKYLVDGSFNPKIIISIFILIWANDTFAFVVGKSSETQTFRTHLSKENH